MSLVKGFIMVHKICCPKCSECYTREEMLEKEIDDKNIRLYSCPLCLNVLGIARTKR